MTAGVIATRIATCLLLALALFQDVAASPVDGAWRIRNLALHIFDCQQLGGVDKPRGGDSPDAMQCDSKLIFRWEIGGDPWFAERR